MKKAYFTREENIDQYLTNKFNVRAYKQLTEKKVFKGLFEPLHFFNLLYENLETVFNNRHKPSKLSAHWKNLDLEIGQLLFLLYKLKEYVSIHNKEENDMQLDLIISNLNFEINVAKKKYRTPILYDKRLTFHMNQESVQNHRSENDVFMRLSQAFEDLFIKREEKGSKPVSKENEKLSDLITHEKSVEIVEGIKIQYKNIKGKSLKLLLKALQDLDLIPKERIAKRFYDACKKEFNWDIASYNAMNGHKYNSVTDRDEVNDKIEFLKSIIKVK